MGLKVYVFFNVQTTESGALYLENQKSHFYGIKNQQSEQIRNEGVVNGILPDDELYQRQETMKTKDKPIDAASLQTKEDSDDDTDHSQIPTGQQHKPSTSKNPVSNKIKKILDNTPRHRTTTPKETETIHQTEQDNHQMTEEANDEKRKSINKAYRKQADRQNQAKRGRPSRSKFN